MSVLINSLIQEIFVSHPSCARFQVAKLNISIGVIEYDEPDMTTENNMRNSIIVPGHCRHTTHITANGNMKIQKISII